MKFSILWTTNGEDYKRDKILSENNEEISFIFSGQRTKGSNNRDHLIKNAKYFVGGKKNKRKLIGKIISITEIPSETEVKLFVVVVEKTKEIEPEIKTKNELCKHYKFPLCDNIMYGITQHYTL